MPPGRSRWMGGAQVPPIHPLRRSARHGHRPLHDNMLTRILGRREARLLHGLPRPHQLGLCQPLHAHVCNAEYGRPRREPQERQLQSVEAYESVLYEQGICSHSPCLASNANILQAVLFTACALNELFFIALYLLCFSSPIITPALLPANGSPGNLTSPADSGSPIQPFHPAPSVFFPAPFSAAAMEMARANKMDSMVPWTLTVVSTPVMLFKQWVNVVQLVKASKWLAEGDRRDRKKAGLGVEKRTEKKRI